MSRRLSPQEADPIGGVVAAPVVVIGATVSVLISMWFTYLHWHEVETPIAAAIGIFLVAGAAVVMIAGALGTRGTFTSERQWLVTTIVTGAAVAEYVSTMGRNQVLYDDYGTVVIGLMLLCMAPYATWTTLLAAAGLSSAVLAILVSGNAASANAAGHPLLSLVLVGSVAIITMAAAGATYSRSVVRSILGWQWQSNRRALLASDASTAPESAGVAVLRDDVLPFLAHVVDAERLSIEDTDRARSLAEQLRGALRSRAGDSWLEALADAVHHGVDVIIDDPDGSAAELSSDQRTALTAIVSWFGNGSRATQVRVVLSEGEGAGRAEVTAVFGASPPRRREIERFVSLARTVGLRAESVVTREHAIVELNYRVP